MEEDLKEIIISLAKQIHNLRTSNEALLRTFIEAFDDPVEGNEMLKKYESTKASFSEQVLLDLEVQFPNLAARLDEDRPLTEE